MRERCSAGAFFAIASYLRILRHQIICSNGRHSLFAIFVVDFGIFPDCPLYWVIIAYAHTGCLQKEIPVYQFHPLFIL